MRLKCNTLLLVLCALAAGCVGNEEPIDPSDIFVEIASADSSGQEIVDFADGDDLELVPGSQAGFHVWTNLRLVGTSGPVFIRREARRVDTGQLVLRGQQLYMEIPNEAESNMWETEAAIPSFMCPSPLGIQVRDMELELVVEVVDGEYEDAAVLGRDSRRFVPRCPEGEELEFCLEICSG